MRLKTISVPIAVSPRTAASVDLVGLYRVTVIPGEKLHYISLFYHAYDCDIELIFSTSNVTRAYDFFDAVNIRIQNYNNLCLNF